MIVRVAKCLIAFGALAFIFGAPNALAQSAASSERLPKNLQCKLKLLRTLGWTIREAPAMREPQITSRAQCDALSAAEVRRSGALAISLPKINSIYSTALSERERAAIERAADDALASTASFCAYASRYANAAQRATFKLAKNSGFQFTEFTQGYAGLLGVYGWQEAQCPSGEGGMQCYVPSIPSRAYEAIYSYRGASAECATGQQIAQGATLYELFGPSIDRYFKPSELIVGRWEDVEATSVYKFRPANQRSWNQPDIIDDQDGSRRARLGAALLVGSPGALENTGGALRDRTYQADNFLIYKTTAAAARFLAQQGGLNATNARLAKFHELAKRIPRDEIYDIGDEKQRLKPRPDRSAAWREAAALIQQDLFLSQTLLYVHGAGVVSLAQKTAELHWINPETGYRVRLHGDAGHAEIRARWLRAQISECEAAP